jgi:mutual gliding-motility protein MglA
MVFFNYSTMQMAAKIVYYGPGLCGKTTNLQHIYGRTSSDSRGEMVSLETETDRTLFFDLLPIDVGSIAGFNTRIQLYTVPGQVFYNTTRKLVLKGVDGVVFVADSQKAMVRANQDSFDNLKENLEEMGLSVEDIPLVLQYNKRDLPDILTVDELDEALNPRGWPTYEASALHGHGVFETLKGISKATLVSLRKRLATPGHHQSGAHPQSTPLAAPAAPAPAAPPTAAPATAAPAVPEAPASVPFGAVEPPPDPTLPETEDDAFSSFPETGPSTRVRPPADLAPPASEPAAPAASAAEPPPTAGRPRATRRGSFDVLNELERLRRQATGSPRASSPLGRNGRSEMTRRLDVALPQDELGRVRSFRISLELLDEDAHLVDETRQVSVDVEDPETLKQLLLRLHIALSEA